MRESEYVGQRAHRSRSIRVLTCEFPESHVSGEETVLLPRMGFALADNLVDTAGNCCCVWVTDFLKYHSIIWGGPPTKNVVPIVRRSCEGLRFLKFANINGRAHAVANSGVVDLATASGGVLSADPMAYVIPSWQARASVMVEQLPEILYRNIDPREFGPPIPRPRNILAVALNYQAHVIESQKEMPAEPAVFAKLASSLCGPYESVAVPDTCTMVDYEAEVVVVIGKKMRGVAAADAWDYVAGVTAGQDISDRFEQRRPPLGQFSLAKSYDTFSPVGPVMATLDEFSDLDRISIVGRVDGREVQRGDTSELIFSISELLAWTCRYVTLEPGDLVFTGTPEGVGSRRTPPLYLSDGMILETEIPGVGTMRNVVRSVTTERSRTSHMPFDAR